MIPMKRRFLISKKVEYWGIIKKDIAVKKPAKGTRNLSKEWEDLKVKYPVVAKFFPVSLEDLVKADYNKLVSIYLTYKEKFVPFLDGMADKNLAEQIKDDIKHTFDYESLKKNDIKKFFRTYGDKLDIHVCFYCECIPIFPYGKAKVKTSQWDLDHVLDKADCPLLCYSLFNFVPSCKNCNSTCKGTKVLGGVYDKSKKTWKLLRYDRPRMIRLSPSAAGYSFAQNVEIDVLPVNTGRGGFLKYRNKYRIEFNTKNNFHDFVDLFKLDVKYNEDDVLAPALDYLDKRRKLPERHKAELASASGVTLDQLENEIYPTEEHRYQLKTLYQSLRSLNLSYPKIK